MGSQTHTDEWEPQTLLDAQALGHVGIWEWDAASGQVRWSAELCRIYGFDADEFVHDFDRFMATVVPEDRPLVEAAMAAAFSTGEGADFELRIVGEDGVPRTLHARSQVTLDEVTGKPVRLLGVTQDITARKQAEQALADSQHRFQAAFDDAPIGMALVDLEGRMFRVNNAVVEMLGRPAEELLELDFAAITHPDDLDSDVEQFNRVLDGDADGYSIEKRYLRPDGSVVWTQLSVSLVRGVDGGPDYFVSQVQDVSAERRLRDYLQHLATHDALTGLHNRRRFDEDLVAQVSRSDRYDEPAAVVVIDLDNFKAVNDTYGHHEGDAVLRRVAEAIRSRLRDSDAAARLGGDEFAVLLLHVDVEQAQRIAAELADAMTAAAGYDVTASFGVAVLDASRGPDDAMRAADRAMYVAKTSRS